MSSDPRCFEWAESNDILQVSVSPQRPGKNGVLVSFFRGGSVCGVPRQLPEHPEVAHLEEMTYRTVRRAVTRKNAVSVCEAKFPNGGGSMSRDDVIIVSLRLLSVYVAMSLIFGIPEVIQGLSFSASVMDVVIIISGLVLLVLLCVILWRLPFSFAGVFPSRLSSNSSGVELREDQDSWEVAGLQLLGVWFLIQSSGDFTYWSVLLVGEWSDVLRRGLLRSDVFLLTGVALLKVLVSLLIILWARTLGKRIRALAR